MSRIFRKPDLPWLLSSIVAAVVLAGALVLPLWRLELVAPQYPAGLVMHAYGYKFADDPGTYYDDVREINGLNHYIGMKEITTVTEMKLFIPGVLALMVAMLGSGFIAWRPRLVRGLVIAGAWFMPLFFVADLQYWLYNYGHTMNPDAALNTGDFTPRVFGTTKVWNFHSETAFEAGFYCMVLAAAIISFGPPLARLASRRLRARSATRTAQPQATAGVAPALILVAGLAAAGAAAAVDARPAAAQESYTLQERIDAARAQDIIVVDGGRYEERIVIDKPISLIGRNWPVIDGGGDGDIVTIAADDVILSGFELRNSGHAVSQEPAAIKVNGHDRASIKGNRIRDAYFGVHATDTEGLVIQNNELRTGDGVPQERRAHGIYLWETNAATVSGNDVRYAADGIHLEFADGNFIVDNRVTESRYALHFMYAHRNTIARNTFTDNLSGAVLMFSHELIVKDNEFSSNRKGATGAGMLLKDNDNLFAEGNRLLRNKHGMTVEGTPQSAGTTAIFRRNTFALNDVGVALTTNSPITFVENAVIDNVVQVKALSANAAATLSAHGAPPASGAATDDPPATMPAAVWSSNGRGNYWSDYEGYDADGDGVGDRGYLPRAPFAGRLDSDPDLHLFQHTLAQQAIDVAADLFPVYRYDAVIEDPHPLMAPPHGLSLDNDSGVNVRLLALSAGLVAAALALIAWARGAGPRIAARPAASGGTV